ncbi:MAG: discoidin domain-containing protein, partial [Nocardioidaceae bacterium]
LDMFGAIDSQHLDAAANWAMMNPLPTTGGDYGMFTPTMQSTVIGRAEELYAQHWGARLVSAHSDRQRLTSYASLSADRAKLYVMLVNNDPDHDATTRISLTGFAPRGDAAAWILDGPTNSDRIEDYGVRRELLSIPAAAGEFTRTVPAYTGEVLEIPVDGSSATVGAAPDLAQDKYASASSSAFHGVSDAMSTDQFIPRNGTDGLDDTRWAAAAFVQQPAWFQVDLGTRQAFDRVSLKWEYWSTAYDVQVSDDGEQWTTVGTQADATAIRKPPEPIDEVRLAHPATGRFVRITMTGRPTASQGAANASTWTPNTFSLWEFDVYLGR